MTTFKVYTAGKIDGGAYRIIEFADGSSRIENWGPKGWVPGGATFGEFFYAPPVSARFAAELDIPISDIEILRDPDTPPPRCSAEVLPVSSLLATRIAESVAEHTGRVGAGAIVPA
jgi:hypothetical protein